MFAGLHNHFPLLTMALSTLLWRQGATFIVWRLYNKVLELRQTVSSTFSWNLGFRQLWAWSQISLHQPRETARENSTKLIFFFPFLFLLLCSGFILRILSRQRILGLYNLPSKLVPKFLPIHPVTSGVNRPQRENNRKRVELRRPWFHDNLVISTKPKTVNWPP